MVQNGVIALRQFLDQQKIKEAFVGTNNPTYQAIAMHLQQKVSVDTYLFRDFFKTDLKNEMGNLRAAETKELDRVVAFYHKSIGAPKGWLEGYLGNLVGKGEVHINEEADEILGACEVRSSTSHPKVANIGMVVSPDHRRKGIGSYLLGKAKEMAIYRGLQPICSCEKGNVASLKSIHSNGFRSVHQVLLLEF